MKKNILLVAVFVAVICLVWVAGDRYGSRQTAVVRTLPAEVAGQPNAPAVTHPTAPPTPALMPAGDWVKYRDARQAALQADPSLQTAYTAILKEMDAQQTKLDAAMVKIDPQMAPVVAKLEALRALHSGTSHPEVSGGTAKTPETINLTADEWQRLRVARTEAIQSNPSFSVEAKKQADDMRVFEDKLDATMLKADPQLAPVIARFETGRHPQAVAADAVAPK